MSNIKISQLTQFTGSSSNTWLVMNNSGQTETFKITRESLLSGLIQCSNVLASESLQSNNFFSVDDLDLNISTRTNSGTKNINLMTGPKPGGLGYTRVKITSGGTVGINTDSPTAQLDVSVPTGTTVGLRVSGNSSAEMVRISQTGGGNALRISGNTLIEGNIIYPSPSTPPVSSGSTGTKGTVTWDGSYFYICVDTNTWKRSQLLSW